MRVVLLYHTPEPEFAVAQAARLCYSAADSEALRRALTPERVARLVRHLVDSGHHSAIEHAAFTFLLEGVSRAMTHQLVRHRIASYSQQSQRYVGVSSDEGGGFACVVPPSVRRAGLADWFSERMAEAQRWYDLLCKKLREAGLEGEDVYQDARYVLPNATQTRIMVTMNARELRHFFRLRLCRRAQWEIREAALEMLKRVKSVAPALFAGAGPACLAGPCPEGDRSCGGAAEVRKRFAELDREVGHG